MSDGKQGSCPHCNKFHPANVLICPYSGKLVTENPIPEKTEQDNELNGEPFVDTLIYPSNSILRDLFPWLLLAGLGLILIASGYYFFKGTSKPPFGQLPPPATETPDYSITSTNSQISTVTLDATQSTEKQSTITPTASNPTQTITPKATTIINSTGVDSPVLLNLRGHTDNVRSVVFNPRGNILASSSSDNTIRLWNVSDGALIFKLTGHDDVVNSIVFNPVQEVLASASDDKTVRLWNVKTGQQVALFRNQKESITSVSFSPDGELLASSSRDGTIVIWDIDKGDFIEKIFSPHFGIDSVKQRIFDVRFSPNSSLLASGGADNNVYIWDPKTGEQYYVLRGHTEDVQSITFSPDGRILASASSDNTIRLWNISNGNLLKILKGHTQKIKGINFTPDSRFLASVSSDNTLRVWRVEDGSLIHQSNLKDPICVAFSPKGQLMALGLQGLNNNLFIIRTPEQLPLADVRPNILLIISDDQRYDTMDYMPQTKEAIFDQGITFARGYITTSSCCPSRSSILTGMYAHNHGVLVNQDELTHDTFVSNLDRASYFTGLVGKYLNSWDGTVRPEFDYWVSFNGGSVSYFDPQLNIQGNWSKKQGYTTQILKDYALEFLEAAGSKEEPFLLIFAPNATHEPAIPAPGDENLYADLDLYRPPNYNEEDVSDKPHWLQERHSLTSENSNNTDNLRRKQLQSLKSLDLAIGAIIDKLEQIGELDKTFIVFISDNGFFWGEHRLYRTKGYAYEESILVPFAIRYPPLIPHSKIEKKLVANIDIAPTIYDLTDLSVSDNLDGKSLIPLLLGNNIIWRDKLIIENWIRYGPYIGVRSDRYLYVEWENDRSELYDMDIDPYQLENQAENSKYGQVISDMQDFIEQLSIRN